MYFESISTEVKVDVVSLQTCLLKYNSYLQKLFITIDSTKYVLKPADAFQLSKDFLKIQNLKYKIENDRINYLSENLKLLVLNICDDIILNFNCLKELEHRQGGNLAKALELEKTDSSEPINIKKEFNIEGYLMPKRILKELKE